MHVRIDQLLSLRDGEPVEAEVTFHLESCASCAAEFGRLRRMQQQMHALPMFEPPANALAQINARMAGRTGHRHRRLAVAAVIGAAVVTTALLVWRLDAGHARTPVAITPAAQPESPVTPTIDHLVAQSRELDEMLERLPERPAVERVAMAATIDSIEQRVQWLDQQLSYAPDTGLNEDQTYRLWRERVDLMDSLVKVRYVEGGRVL